MFSIFVLVSTDMCLSSRRVPDRAKPDIGAVCIAGAVARLCSVSYSNYTGVNSWTPDSEPSACIKRDGLNVEVQQSFHPRRRLCDALTGMLFCVGGGGAVLVEN